jgi:hypothetical protein
LERIHPAWWSPRLFPFVLSLVGLAAMAAAMLGLRKPAGIGPLILGAIAVVALLAAQFRLGRVVLGPDSIKFPEWRDEDASEAGVHLGVHRSVPRGRADEVSTIAAGEIRDWTREPGRIVITLRDGRRHGIGLRGFRERDRERIVAWLVEKVGG